MPAGLRVAGFGRAVAVTDFLMDFLVKKEAGHTHNGQDGYAHEKPAHFRHLDLLLYSFLLIHDNTQDKKSQGRSQPPDHIHWDEGLSGHHAHNQHGEGNLAAIVEESGDIVPGVFLHGSQLNTAQGIAQ